MANMSVRLSIQLLVCISFCVTLAVCHSLYNKKSKFHQEVDCDQVPEFTQELRNKIRSKQAEVDKIIEYVTKGEGKHSTYNDLALVCDTFGPRLSGTKSHRDAIEHMSNKMREEAKVKTYNESAMIPHWWVGNQWAEISAPVRHKMQILALGYSVGTNNKVLEAEAQVVHSFDELDQLGKDGKINGKIVVYNYNFTEYAESVLFRTEGALKAAKYNAVAALVRSVTPFSIYSPHAGAGSESIPTAAITLEDADKIQRWVNRNKKVSLKLYMETKHHPDVESVNLIGEIPGTTSPDEVVLVSGHSDSWYNTDGAMDDGGGMMISYKAIEVLSKLNIKAKRTMRAILWTAEEPGLIGVKQYFNDHKHELDKFKVVMESDLGTFTPTGLSFKNFGPLGQCIAREMLNLTASIETTTLDDKYEGSDIEYFTDAGVAGMSLANKNDRYFWFHHTSGDSITMENPDDLDKCTALWASALYVFADLEGIDFRK